MGRFRAFALILASAAANGQILKSGPVITVAVDAPLQPDSPVHVTGFQHDQREIWFTLLNSSEKTVTSVILGNASWAPSRCTMVGNKLSRSHVRFLVHVGPHGSGVASSGYVHYPSALVNNARMLKAACMLTQIVVDAVYFEDGTTWPPALDSDLASAKGPFDLEHHEAEAGTSTDPLP